MCDSFAWLESTIAGIKVPPAALRCMIMIRLADAVLAGGQHLINLCKIIARGSCYNRNRLCEFLCAKLRLTVLPLERVDWLNWARPIHFGDHATL